MSMQAAGLRDRERPRWLERAKDAVSLKRSPLAYGALVAFFFVYYYRPEDLIHPLALIPLAKIAGTIAILPMVDIIFGGGGVKLPRAMKLLWIMVLQLTLCIPFALWPGRAFHSVFDALAKGVLISTVIAVAIVRVSEVRRLMWIQVSAVALVTFLSIATRHFQQDRLAGVQEGILENPNDLAINIAICFPLALAFLLRAKDFRKAVWAGSLAVLCYGVFLTGSRSGLLALICSVAACVWEYGVKGKRRSLIGVTLLIAILGGCVGLASSHYRARVESIFLGNIEGSDDQNSRAARVELLKKSLSTAAAHPIFGVGPGCFPLVDAGWRVAHNAYTELAAEGGILGITLFLMAIAAAFKNIRDVRKLPLYKSDPELQLFVQSLWAGLVAYLTGSLFASTEYQFYPYYMVGFTCVLLRIAQAEVLPELSPERPGIYRASYGGMVATPTIRTR